MEGAAAPSIALLPAPRRVNTPAKASSSGSKRKSSTPGGRTSSKASRSTPQHTPAPKLEGPLPIVRLPENSPLLVLLGDRRADDADEGYLHTLRGKLGAGVVRPDVRLLINQMPRGLAAEYHKMGVNFALLEAAKPKTVCAWLKFAALLYKLSSRPLHLPILRTTALAYAAGATTTVFAGHYPSRFSEQTGYHYPNGHAGDPSTAVLERAVGQSLDLADHDVFSKQFEVAIDAFGGACNHEVPRNGNGRLEPFSFKKHLFKKLSREEQVVYRDSHVEMVAGQFEDEIAAGRTGASMLLCGKVASEWTSLIAVDAAALAAKRANMPYTLLIPGVSDGAALPDGVPTSKPRRRGELCHICVALEGNMPKEERRRWDAALSIVFKHRGGVQFKYFEEQGNLMGSVSWEETMQLRWTAEARAGGYKGPCPLSAKLTPDQKTLYDTARGVELRRRVAVGAARSGGYGGQGPLPYDAVLSAVEKLEFEKCIRVEMERRAFETRTTVAETGGYTGPRPQPGVPLGPDHQADLDEAYRTTLKVWGAASSRRTDREVMRGYGKLNAGVATKATRTGPIKKGAPVYQHKCRNADCGSRFQSGIETVCPKHHIGSDYCGTCVGGSRCVGCWTD